MTDSTNPGRGLGIAGLVLAFLIPPLGLILSIVAKVRSSRAGIRNGVATAGIVVSIVVVILWIVGIVLAGSLLFGGILQTCAELGPGVWDVGGVTYTCG
ncbi:hypothetical protein GCM10022239_21920 [Leifsonia bigeumensis]|uniref:DUF4190 domain-containing protein n=1 Tax=Leifsonella bigeumensis TaxID=433643 RepID=A0ABP7FTS0_9MICO